ncbi:MAG TPA: sensor domain-containing diguanylate cyclase [Acidimicrobiales bacterium]
MDAVAASQPEGRDDERTATLRAVLAVVTDPVVVLDDQGAVFGASEAFHALLGATPADAEAIDALLTRPAGEPVVQHALRGVSGTDIEVHHARTGRRLAVTAQPVVTDGRTCGVVATVRELAATGDDADTSTLVDPLTGLANLDGLLAHVERHLESGHGELAVLRVDIERFRALNERLGREAGDEVLRQLAEILGRSVRGHDFVSRIGGGEFAVAYHGVGDAQLLAVINRVTRSVCTELTVDGQSVAVTCNVAAATVLPGDDANTLVQRADARRPRTVAGPPMGGRPLVRR